MTDYPAGWALMKPQQTIEPEKFNVMWPTGNYIATRKRDGNRGHIMTAGAKTRIYSRNGTLDWTEKLEHLIPTFERAPHGLLIDVELHTMEEGTSEFQNAMNNNPEEIHWSGFDVLGLDGRFVNNPYRDRYAYISQLEDTLPTSHWGGGIFFNLPGNAKYEDVLERIKKAKCEGVVIWDARAPHALNTRGNTKRGQSWKIKPRMTEDLVVTKVNACADPSLGCGSLNVARMTSPGMPLKPIKAAIGSFELGFDRHEALRLQKDFIVEVSHYGEDENGNLTFAKVVRLRNDLLADFGMLKAA